MDEMRKNNNELPEELQDELSRLQRREKIYTWVVAGALSVVVFLGINWLTGPDKDFNSNSYSAGFVNAGGSGGGCCSSGSGGSAGSLGFVSNSAGGSGGGCGVGGGGGCGGSSTANVDLTVVEAEGLSYYQQAYKDEDVTAKVTNYGCHIQCDIYKEGQVVKSFAYQNGQFIEI